MLTASWFLKKNLPIGTRGSFAPLVFSIGVCLATFGVGISASAQSPVLDDRRHDTPGRQFRPGGSVHVDVDLALVPSYLVRLPATLKSYRIVSLWPPRAALPPCSMAYIWESVK